MIEKFQKLEGIWKQNLDFQERCKLVLPHLNGIAKMIGKSAQISYHEEIEKQNLLEHFPIDLVDSSFQKEEIKYLPNDQKLLKDLYQLFKDYQSFILQQTSTLTGEQKRFHEKKNWLEFEKSLDKLLAKNYSVSDE